MLTKKLNYYMRLQYPVRIIAGDDGLVGSLPDLPGCAVVADSAPAVYAALELARRSWLEEHVAAGEDIPLPNSSLGGGGVGSGGGVSNDDAEGGVRTPDAYAQREATPF